MGGFLLAALIVLTAIPASVAGEYELSQRFGEKTVTLSQRLLRTAEGYLATIESSDGATDRLVMDSERSTLEWRRSFPAEGTEIVAKRSGSTVSLTGRFKNKPVSVVEKIGDLPWFQFQELSYPAILDKRAAEFWTISRRDLKAASFRAELQGSETLEVMGGSVSARRFLLTVKGIPRAVFKSSYWLRSSDGVFLRLEVPPVFGFSGGGAELVGERPVS